MISGFSWKFNGKMQSDYCAHNNIIENASTYFKMCLTGTMAHRQKYYFIEILCINRI